MIEGKAFNLSLASSAYADDFLSETAKLPLL